jgi:arsenate reductase-like glutaredoxin family protein
MTVRERDFFKQPLSEAELLALLGETPPADAFAWNSPRARAMHLSRQKPPPDDELVRLMLDNPYLIRRPLIRIGGRTLFGFDQREVESLVE